MISEHVATWECLAWPNLMAKTSYISAHMQSEIKMFFG
uniref:Uncharacterized protein n=1 Tax=Anguilla anguilla TaxID=7936 RepID=A0A0E9TR54_ANGAN